MANVASVEIQDKKLLARIEENIRQFGNLQIGVPAGTYAALGDSYYYGRNGLEHNPSKAFLCYNLGAKRGEASSFFRLAAFYKTADASKPPYIKKSSEMAQSCYETAVALSKK